MIVYGRVEGLTGPLPGAVIKVNNSKLVAVTNSKGEFRMEVPADSGPLPAVASYAGYADVPVVLEPTNPSSTVKLTSPRVIKVKRKQQLKKYMKTAHRQARQSMRRL
jgi:hypothetical protein